VVLSVLESETTDADSVDFSQKRDTEGRRWCALGSWGACELKMRFLSANMLAALDVAVGVFFSGEGECSEKGKRGTNTKLTK
jgi:hypothetical protein